MKDFMGKELTVGDVVVYQASIGNSGTLLLVKVVGFTAKKVKIEGSFSWNNASSNVDSTKLIITPQTRFLRHLDLEKVKEMHASGKLDKLSQLLENDDYKDYPMEWMLASLDD